MAALDSGLGGQRGSNASSSTVWSYRVPVGGMGFHQCATQDSVPPRLVEGMENKASAFVAAAAGLGCSG